MYEFIVTSEDRHHHHFYHQDCRLLTVCCNLIFSRCQGAERKTRDEERKKGAKWRQPEQGKPAANDVMAQKQNQRITSRVDAAGQSALEILLIKLEFSKLIA